MNLDVIIPFYRELDFIDRGVSSVLINFSVFDHVRILLCNDGHCSEAEIRAQVSEQGNKIMRVLPNCYPKGPGGARNTGLDASTAEFVAFLDADDFWLPSKIDQQMNAIRQGATFVTTSYRLDSEGVLIMPPARINRPLDVFLRRGIGTSTVLLTRTLLAKNRFKDLRFAQDIDFWYALARSSAFRYARVTSQLVEYSTSGSTKNKLVQLQYLQHVLNVNHIDYWTQAKVLSSYIVAGIYNHYIKRINA